jgi:copper(I)-binding protein
VNRALRAAAIGVLLVAPVTLSACSAGQVNQTASQIRDQFGATAQVGDLTLRGVQLEYPPGGTLSPGDEAGLQAAIINNGSADDTLVSISGPGFTGVAVTGTGTQSTQSTSGGATSSAATSSSATSSAAPTSSAAATSSSAAATTGATTTGSTSPGLTTPPASSTSALPSTAPTTSVSIPIPANSVVYLGQNAPHVTLTGLTESLNAALPLKVTFTFQRAGAVTLEVYIGDPPSVLSNTSTYNFSESGSAG